MRNEDVRQTRCIAGIANCHINGKARGLFFIKEYRTPLHCEFCTGAGCSLIAHARHEHSAPYSLQNSKGKFLYTAVFNRQDCSKSYTIYSVADLHSTFSHAATNERRLFVHK